VGTVIFGCVKRSKQDNWQRNGDGIMNEVLCRFTFACCVVALTMNSSEMKCVLPVRFLSLDATIYTG